MKLETDAQDLRAALATAASIVERRNTKPILGMVMIYATARRVIIKGTDSDIEVSATCDANIMNIGRAMVWPRLMAGALRYATGRVTITADDATVVVTMSDGVTLRMSGMPPSDMPTIGKPGGNAVTLPAADLYKWLSAVRVSISTEETRYYLNGAYLHAVDGNLVMASTDGRRLSRYTTRQAWPFDPTIVPTKTVDALLRMTRKGGNEPVAVAIEGHRMAANGDGWSIASKLIDGKYPEYTRAIPAPSNIIGFTISKHTLARLPDDVSARCAKIDPGAGVMSITDPGAFNASVPIIGHGPAVSFNVQYLRAFARGHEALRISSSSPGEPAMIVGDDPDLLMVLMPMRY